ncbi:MAG: hypothetical protein JOZ16_04470 [Methylobacteriaceae bacterium]|nr:hypothetical protein [Methylobacteriaceae bacterium]
MCRIVGERVETSVPAWLLNAGATYAIIRFITAVAQQLMADPAAHGFTVANEYTLFVQSWDRATTDVASLAFGRNVLGHEAVGLIPDVYYINHFGYRDVRHSAVSLPMWRDRRNAIAWRGSVTGGGDFYSPSDIPRVQLALRCRDIAVADVALFGVHSTMAGIFPPEQIEAFITAERLEGDRWHMPHFGTYRYAIDIDGHANAWAFLEKLILGCCVLKVGSPYEQWFYGDLRPWVHYVPVRADLSDLDERIDWCLVHQDECEWIAQNGARFAASCTYEREVCRACGPMLAAASVRPRR